MIAIAATPVAAVAPAVADYRFTVHGAAGEVVHLRTHGIPHGWLVTFCTGKLCEPYRYDTTLDSRGHAQADLRVFPREAHPVALRRFTVQSADGAHVRVTLR